MWCLTAKQVLNYFNTWQFVYLKRKQIKTKNKVLSFLLLFWNRSGNSATVIFIALIYIKDLLLGDKNKIKIKSLHDYIYFMYLLPCFTCGCSPNG